MSKLRIVDGAVMKNSEDATELHVYGGSFTAGAAKENIWLGDNNGITEHDYKKSDEEKEPDEEILINGHFYNEDGNFEGAVNKKENTGSVNDVYTCTGTEEKTDKEQKPTGIYTYNDAKILKDGDKNIAHPDFAYVCYVVKMEAGKSDIKELKCIAFTSHNRSVNMKTSWKKLLSTRYSCVDDKKQLPKESKDEKSKLCRKAVFAVLNSEEDLTKGAEYWDGTDFLAWGNSEMNPDNKLGQNKFDEYKFIEIPKAVYDEFLKANGTSTRYKDKDNHDTKTDQGTHEHIHKKKISPLKDKAGKAVLDKNNKPVYEEIEVPDRIRYEIPAKEFKDEVNWTSGDFYYATGIATPDGISATIAAGKSIFWKITATRLMGTK